MSVRTIHLSARSKQLYAERRTDRPRLHDLRMGYDCQVRAFVRPRRRVTDPASAPLRRESQA